MPSTSRRAFLQQSATLAATATWAGAATLGQAPPAREVRLGLIGLDTSHVTVFTKLFNRPPEPVPQLAGVRVVAAFPAGNPDFPLSKNRLEGFTREVRELGVEIVDSIPALVERVDGVLLESVDGTQHLAQAREVFQAGKPLFIDKPLAASLPDVLAIAELGRRHDVPWFTASASRFTAGYPELRGNPAVGDILGCDAYSQSRAAPGHPDLFWYGMHGVDLLYSLMGTGCQSVSASQTRYTEQVTGLWTAGRVGTYRGIREHTGQTGLGVTVFGSKGIAHCNNYYDYQPLVVAVAEFFRTRRSPIPADEMVEVFTYLAAAEESKGRRGQPVPVAEVVAAAQAQLR